MRKIREVLRLKGELSLSHRGISASTGISRNTVSDYVGRVERAGLTWEAAKELSDVEVEARLFQQVGRLWAGGGEALTTATKGDLIDKDL